MLKPADTSSHKPHMREECPSTSTPTVLQHSVLEVQVGMGKKGLADPRRDSKEAL